jgi:Zn-dependent protease
MIIFQFLIILYSVILHEISHGWVANKLGDPTAKISGRITLNPISHIDPFMTIIFPIILTLIGSPVIFGAAKPVPVNEINLNKPKRDMALVSLAGPLTNFIIAIISVILTKLISIYSDRSSSVMIIEQLMIFSTFTNIILGIMNIIPIPPLDGSKIIAAFFPDYIFAKWRDIDRIGIFILITLIVLFGQSITSFIYNAANTMTNILLTSETI